jgi:hypothetical protein
MAALSDRPRARIVMAPKATVAKAELQVTDMDRHYYASHNLTLAFIACTRDARTMTPSFSSRAGMLATGALCGAQPMTA